MLKEAINRKEQVTINKLVNSVQQLSSIVEQFNQNQKTDFDGWITNERLIRQFGICPKTAYNWRCSGLPYVTNNRRIYYHRNEIEKFFKKFNYNS